MENFLACKVSQQVTGIEIKHLALSELRNTPFVNLMLWRAQIKLLLLRR